MATQTTGQSAPEHDRIGYFRRLWRTRGYVEVVAGANEIDAAALGYPQGANPDPDKIALLVLTKGTFDECKRLDLPHNRKWFFVNPGDPKTYRAVDRAVNEWAARYGNVYVGVSVYADKRRSAGTLTSAVLVEDAPAPGAAPLPYSFAVQTSPASWHAFYDLDTPLAHGEYEKVARRVAHALGADPSGVDAEQLTRPPWTLNTKAKYGGAFAVNLAVDAEHVYTVAGLCDAFGAAPATRGKRIFDSTSTDDALWARAAVHIANIETLMPRLLKAVKPATQTGGILRGELAPGVRVDRSLNRCTVADGLRAHGFDADIAAAVLFTQCDWGHSDEKGTDWLRADIERCIAHSIERYPNKQVKPFDYDKPYAAAPIPHKERRTRGRPRAKVDTAALARILPDMITAGDRVMLDRGGLAVALGVSVPTVDRALKPLKGAGLVEWVTYSGRQSAALRVDRAGLAAFDVLSKIAPTCDQKSASTAPTCYQNEHEKTRDCGEDTPQMPIGEIVQRGNTPPPVSAPAEVAPPAPAGVLPLPYSAGEVDAARAWLAERPTLIATYLARGAVADPGYWACRVEDGYNHAALSAALAELAPVAGEVDATEVVEDAGAAPPEAPAPLTPREMVAEIMHIYPRMRRDRLVDLASGNLPDMSARDIGALIDGIRRERDASIFTAIREEAASATPGELRKRHGAAVTTLRDLEHKAQSGSARRTGTRKGEAYTEEERGAARQRLGLARFRAEIFAGELERRGLANQEPPAPKASKARAPLAWFGMPEQFATAAD